MNKIALYTLSTVPWCRKSKQFFQERNIRFEYTDYDIADDQAQKHIIQVMDQHQATAFPFAMINGDAVEGYNPARYTSLLGLAG
jgi:glutaredoxin